MDADAYALSLSDKEQMLEEYLPRVMMGLRMASQKPHLVATDTVASVRNFGYDIRLQLNICSALVLCFSS